MDCQGNLILHGLPADMNVTPQSLIKADGGLCAGLWLYYVWMCCAAEKNNNGSYIWCSSMNTWEWMWQEWRPPPPQRELQPKKSQGQVCRLRCATVVDWQQREGAAAWTGALHLLKINSNLSVAATRHIWTTAFTQYSLVRFYAGSPQMKSQRRLKGYLILDFTDIL